MIDFILSMLNAVCLRFWRSNHSKQQPMEVVGVTIMNFPRCRSISFASSAILPNRRRHQYPSSHRSHFLPVSLGWIAWKTQLQSRSDPCIHCYLALCGAALLFPRSRYCSGRSVACREPPPGHSLELVAFPPVPCDI